jgi:hypothetical protein
VHVINHSQWVDLPHLLMWLPISPTDKYDACDAYDAPAQEPAIYRLYEAIMHGGEAIKAWHSPILGHTATHSYPRPYSHPPTTAIFEALLCACAFEIDLRALVNPQYHPCILAGTTKCTLSTYNCQCTGDHQ